MDAETEKRERCLPVARIQRFRSGAESESGPDVTVRHDAQLSFVIFFLINVPIVRIEGSFWDFSKHKLSERIDHAMHSQKEWTEAIAKRIRLSKGNFVVSVLVIAKKNHNFLTLSMKWETPENLHKTRQNFCTRKLFAEIVEFEKLKNFLQWHCWNVKILSQFYSVLELGCTIYPNVNTERHIIKELIQFHANSVQFWNTFLGCEIDVNFCVNFALKSETNKVWIHTYTSCVFVTFLSFETPTVRMKLELSPLTLHWNWSWDTDPTSRKLHKTKSCSQENTVTQQTNLIQFF